MLNIVLFGPPGAGKGTQSYRLIERYKLNHLSTGDIFRANIKGETKLGLLARKYMDQGKLVPDEVTIGMLQSEVEKHPGARGFVFDGFPRTIEQAVALDQLLQAKNTSVTLMLALEVPEDELVKRLLERATISGRADDADMDVIQKRIAVYRDETEPVKSYYQRQGKLQVINGVGSIDDIFGRLCTAIDKSYTPAGA